MKKSVIIFGLLLLASIFLNVVPPSLTVNGQSDSPYSFGWWYKQQPQQQQEQQDDDDKIYKDFEKEYKKQHPEYYPEPDNPAEEKSDRVHGVASQVQEEQEKKLHDTKAPSLKGLEGKNFDNVIGKHQEDDNDNDNDNDSNDKDEDNNNNDDNDNDSNDDGGNSVEDDKS